MILNILQIKYKNNVYAHHMIEVTVVKILIKKKKTKDI